MSFNPIFTWLLLCVLVLRASVKMGQRSTLKKYGMFTVTFTSSIRTAMYCAYESGILVIFVK